MELPFFVPSNSEKKGGQKNPECFIAISYSPLHRNGAWYELIIPCMKVIQK